MHTLTPDAIAARARELGSGPEAVGSLLADVGDDRTGLEAARDHLAVYLHTHVDDFQATAALQLLNRALATLPRHDPLDWRVRWGQRFRMP
jgi:hypothetical protein